MITFKMANCAIAVVKESLMNEVELIVRLSGLAQDPNWQTRTVKLREELSTHNITIECTGEQNLGNCYNASYFTVTSKRLLSNQFLYYLKELGLLGCGQEFWFKKAIQKDGVFIVEAQSRVDSSG